MFLETLVWTCVLTVGYVNRSLTSRPSSLLPCGIDAEFRYRQP
jgi:hypothetical protein